MKNRFEMYSEYIKEISEYGAKIGPVEIWRGYRSYCDTSNYDWIPVMDGETEAGFLIIGKGYPNCRYGYDYYIAETYMLRRHRRKGLMLNTVKEYLETHKGRYCLFILDKNKAALYFWKNVERTCNLKPLIIDEPLDDEVSKEYGFLNG